MLLTIKLILIGVVSIVAGVSSLTTGWSHALVGIGLIAFGLLLIFTGIRKFLVPASVGGGSSSVTSSGSTPTETGTDGESPIENVSMFGNERRIIRPHDSLPSLPFKM
jgi:hypothetical protein